MLSSLFLIALAANPPQVALSVSGAPADSTVARALPVRLATELTSRNARVVDLKLSSPGQEPGCRQDLPACLKNGGLASPQWVLFAEYEPATHTLRLELWQPPFTSPTRAVARSFEGELQLLDGVHALLDELLEPLAYPGGRRVTRDGTKNLAIAALTISGACLLGAGLSLGMTGLSYLDMSNRLQREPNITPVEVTLLRQQGEAQKIVPVVLVAAAGVSALTGLGALWLSRSPELPTVTASVGPTGGAVGLAWVLQ